MTPKALNFNAIAGRYSYRAGESYPKVSRGVIGRAQGPAATS